MGEAMRHKTRPTIMSTKVTFKKSKLTISRDYRDINYQKIIKQGKEMTLTKQEVLLTEKEKTDFHGDKILNKRMRTEKKMTNIDNYKTKNAFTILTPKTRSEVIYKARNKY